MVNQFIIMKFIKDRN